MEIEVKDLTESLKPATLRLIKGKIGKALKTLGEEKAWVSLLFVDNAFIKSLNLKYRGIDEPTDVLSFPMREQGEAEGLHPQILGDIVISIEKAQSQAQADNKPLEEELSLLLIHGLLHLLGHDHQSPKEKVGMDRLQSQLLSL